MSIIFIAGDISDELSALLGNHSERVTFPKDFGEDGVYGRFMVESRAKSTNESEIAAEDVCAHDQDNGVVDRRSDWLSPHSEPSQVPPNATPVPFEPPNGSVLSSSIYTENRDAHPLKVNTENPIVIAHPPTIHTEHSNGIGRTPPMHGECSGGTTQPQSFSKLNANAPAFTPRIIPPVPAQEPGTQPNIHGMQFNCPPPPPQHFMMGGSQPIFPGILRATRVPAPVGGMVPLDHLHHTQTIPNPMHRPESYRPELRSPVYTTIHQQQQQRRPSHPPYGQQQNIISPPPTQSFSSLPSAVASVTAQPMSSSHFLRPMHLSSASYRPPPQGILQRAPPPPNPPHPVQILKRDSPIRPGIEVPPSMFLHNIPRMTMTQNMNNANTPYRNAPMSALSPNTQHRSVKIAPVHGGNYTHQSRISQQNMDAPPQGVNESLKNINTSLKDVDTSTQNMNMSTSGGSLTTSNGGVSTRGPPAQNDGLLMTPDVLSYPPPFSIQFGDFSDVKISVENKNVEILTDSPVPRGLASAKTNSATHLEEASSVISASSIQKEGRVSSKPDNGLQPVKRDAVSTKPSEDCGGSSGTPGSLPPAQLQDPPVSQSGPGTPQQPPTVQKTPASQQTTTSQRGAAPAQGLRSQQVAAESVSVPPPQRNQTAGNQSAGNQSAGNQTAGNQTAGNQTAGNQTAGKQTAGKQTAGNQTAGNQTAGNQTAGNQTAGNQTAGNQTAGNQTAGNQTAGNQTAGNQTAGNQTAGNQTAAAAVPSKPKSWAQLVSNTTSATQSRSAESASGGAVAAEKGEQTLPSAHLSVRPANEVGAILSATKVNQKEIPLQPRRLINLTNWCYINSTLQALLACPPLCHMLKALPSYPALSTVKSVTPVLDAMVEFVTHFPEMSTDNTTEKKGPGKSNNPVDPSEPQPPPAKGWRRQQQQQRDIGKGAAFEPLCVYEVLSLMKTSEITFQRGKQEDAEEFLTCLLNKLHEESGEAIKQNAAVANHKEDGGSDGKSSKAVAEGMVNGHNGTLHSLALHSEDEEADDGEEWEEVGPKNKSVVTHSHGYKTSTPISDIFGGLLRSSLSTGGSSKESAVLEPFFTVPLNVTENRDQTVESALHSFVSKEVLDGYTCPKTKQELDAHRRLTFERLPPILILHLKCFVYKKESSISQKVMHKIRFGETLEFDKELLSSQAKHQPKDHRSYKLFAVAYHTGEKTTGGHYHIDVYHTGVDGWIRFDDHSLTPTSPAQVFDERPPQCVPYLLYYKRADMVQASNGGGGSSYTHRTGANSSN